MLLNFSKSYIDVSAPIIHHNCVCLCLHRFCQTMWRVCWISYLRERSVNSSLTSLPNLLLFNTEPKTVSTHLLCMFQLYTAFILYTTLFVSFSTY